MPPKGTAEKLGEIYWSVEFASCEVLRQYFFVLEFCSVKVCTTSHTKCFLCLSACAYVASKWMTSVHRVVHNEQMNYTEFHQNQEVLHQENISIITISDTPSTFLTILFQDSSQLSSRLLFFLHVWYCQTFCAYRVLSCHGHRLLTKTCGLTLNTLVNQKFFLRITFKSNSFLLLFISLRFCGHVTWLNCTLISDRLHATNWSRGTYVYDLQWKRTKFLQRSCWVWQHNRWSMLSHSKIVFWSRKYH